MADQRRTLETEPVPYTASSGPIRSLRPDADRRGEIGELVTRLREQHGMALSAIAQAVSDHLGRHVPTPTLHAWSMGREPRGGTGEVIEALRRIAEQGKPIDGGAWCAPDEAQRRVETLNQYKTINEMHALTAVPKSTIIAWLSGMHRAPRKRLNEFENVIQQAIAS
jgi:hypothetical protein